MIWYEMIWYDMIWYDMIYVPLSISYAPPWYHTNYSVYLSVNSSIMIWYMSYMSHWINLWLVKNMPAPCQSCEFPWLDDLLTWVTETWNLHKHEEQFHAILNHDPEHEIFWRYPCMDIHTYSGSVGRAPTCRWTIFSAKIREVSFPLPGEIV